MDKVLGKFLIGSYNYNLNIEKSDKDYKIIEMPTFEDIFNHRKLNRKLDENNSVVDYRFFVSHILRANPNTLELLFSTEAFYENKDFSDLVIYIKSHLNSIIRVNWKGFVSSMKGMALDSLKRYDSKGVSRAFYLYFLLDRVYKNCGKMTEEDWRNPNLLYPCRDIRTNNDVFKQALSYTKNFDTLFDSFKELAVMPIDIKLTNKVQEECLIFFKDYLTNN